MKTQDERVSYSYCNICGHEPKTNADPCNFVQRFWDVDDGWKIAALCVYCWQDVEFSKPKPEDYAYTRTNGIADDINTDIDPLLVL